MRTRTHKINCTKNYFGIIINSDMDEMGRLLDSNTEQDEDDSSGDLKRQRIAMKPELETIVEAD